MTNKEDNIANYLVSGANDNIANYLVSGANDNIANYLVSGAAESDSLTTGTAEESITIELADGQKEEVCPCALHIGDKSGVCSAQSTIKKIAEHLDIPGNLKPEEKIEAAKEILNVETEAEVLKKIAGKIPEAHRDLKERFKMEGPADSTALFNNNHIDETLSSWEKRWPDFHHIGFQFIDFMDDDANNNELKKLTTPGYITSLYNKGIRTISCVLNTDVHTGPGKHWICVFIDMRGDKWTVEYFNSSGNPPAYKDWTITKWANSVIDKLRELNPSKKTDFIYVCKLQLQYSNTECGPYCMYYIYNRLKNKPYDKFSYGDIPDDKVTKFRKMLFRPA
jgi:hypothetical protein